MPDFLEKLVNDAKKRVSAGYYVVRTNRDHKPVSLASAIKQAPTNAIIAEIKPISPSKGPLRPTVDPADAASKLVDAGAVGLSILTEPDNFGGSLENLRIVRGHVEIPLLMKDVVVDNSQILAAKFLGADCVLLMLSVISKCDGVQLESMIREIHRLGLEALVEVHDKQELDIAVGSEADIVGINNRNLSTLETDLETTSKLMKLIDKPNGKVFISESGLESAEDIRRLKSSIVDGFLIGSAIMLSPDMEGKAREFVLA